MWPSVNGCIPETEQNLDAVDILQMEAVFWNLGALMLRLLLGVTALYLRVMKTRRLTKWKGSSLGEVRAKSNVNE